jgi:serine phosphatase RsbU (regulator of sigma subunit)
MRKTLLTILSATLWLAAAAQFATPEHKIVSGIYTFMVNTQWKNEASLPSFTIGVLDQDSSFYKLCIEKYNGVLIRKKPIQVVLYNSIEALSAVQVLYVNKKFNRKIDKVGEKIKGQNTLLITNTCKNDKIVMINYNSILKKKEYDISEVNIAAAGLDISGNFVEFAEDKISWQELYQQSVTNLEKEREKVKTQEKTITSQRYAMSAQLNTIEEKEKYLQMQEKDIARQRKVLVEQLVEIELRQKKIAAQKEGMIAQLAEIQKQRLIMILFSVVLVLVIGMVFMVYRSYRIKRRNNIKLAEKNAAITLQKEEIEEKNEKLNVLNADITRKNRQILDSIAYAQRIQNALLPFEEIYKKYFDDYFILYNPKNIVSGDFYWTRIISNDKTGTTKLAIAVADCTGHGVPGAFMSMLGMTTLSDITANPEEYENQEIAAHEVLFRARKHIISSLKQTGKKGEQKTSSNTSAVRDGMDMTLCIFDLAQLTSDNPPPYYDMEFAGANNPVFIIRHGTDPFLMDEISQEPVLSSENANLFMYELKPDKMPIGIYLKGEQPFTSHQVKLKKGDIIFNFTDGYIDQQGGEDKSKFMKHKFRELLLSYTGQALPEQKEKIEQVHHHWKKDFDQTDDITILGLKL